MVYVFGILAIILGAFMVIKTEAIVEMFGTSAWAEEHFGGGTYFFYKLIGLAFILVSAMAMTGLLGQLFLGIFGGIFGIPR